VVPEGAPLVPDADPVLEPAPLATDPDPLPLAPRSPELPPLVLAPVLVPAAALDPLVPAVLPLPPPELVPVAPPDELLPDDAPLPGVVPPLPELLHPVSRQRVPRVKAAIAGVTRARLFMGHALPHK